MRKRTLAALTLCLLAASLASAGTVAGAPSSGAAPLSPGSPAQPSTALQSPAADSRTSPSLAATQDVDVTRPLTVEIQVRSDGDARFVLRKEFPAGTEARRDAFRNAVEEPFEDGDYELGYDTFQSVVPNVSDHTGREMSLENPERDAFVSDGTGVVERRFTWQNFANATDGEIVAEDAFYTASGPWLRSIPAHFRLVLRSPDGYRVSHSEQGVSREGQAVVWEVENGASQHVFQPGEFRTVFVEDDDRLDFGLLPVAGLVLIAVGVLLYLLTRRYDLPRRGPDETAADGEGTGGAAAESSTTAAPEEATAGGATPADGLAADGVAEQSPDVTGGPSPESESGEADADEADVDPELLSDEERVERLLNQNGGRMKQASIVEETGWSNAKVSQLLSEMAEDDRVDKLRIGRENLISLPDEDVTATE